jgi:hypothetical protein
LFFALKQMNLHGRALCYRGAKEKRGSELITEIVWVTRGSTRRLYPTPHRLAVFYKSRSPTNEIAETEAAPEGGKKIAASTGTDWATYTRETPGVSAFALDDGVVYHTYSDYARAGTDETAVRRSPFTRFSADSPKVCYAFREQISIINILVDSNR